MFPKLVASFLMLAVAASAAGALKLSATVHEYTSQGILYRQLKFSDEGRTVAMELPNRWTFRSGPARLELVPPDKKFAEGSMDIGPLPPGQPLDEAAMQAFEKHAIAAVPPASQAITVSARNQMVLFDGKPAFQVAVSYRALGESFRRSTTYVNFADSRLTIQVTAKESDFEQVADTFHRSAFGLTWE